MNPEIQCYNNGKFFSKEWTVNNRYHREDGPAIQRWRHDGSLWCEEWYIDNMHHRVDGPAYIRLSYEGRNDYSEWYFYGRQLDDNKIEDYKEWLISNNLVGKYYTQWTDEEKVLWRLSWK